MRAALFLLVIAACSGKGEKAAPVATSPSGSGSAVETPTPKAVEAPNADKKALPPEDPEAHKKYRAALNKGRKATDAKKYKDAIAAFDEALAIKKGDARAISERGYARLLSGDLDGASRDLDDSATRSKDRKLLSSIWYNRGLVDEKRGKQDSALVAFYMANALRPTDAAAKKIAGKTVCPVAVYRPYDRQDDVTNTWEATDWQDLAKQSVEELEDKRPATEAEALDALFGAKTAPTLPTTMTIRSFGDATAYVVWKDGNKLRAIPIGYAMGGRCPGTLAFEAVSSSGSQVFIHGTEAVDGGHTYMCEDKHGDLYECTGADNEVGAGTACLGSSPTEYHLVFDAKQGKVVLGVGQPEFPDGEDSVHVSFEPTGIKLSGKGCGDRIEKL
jgi:hypothetical protein